MARRVRIFHVPRLSMRLHAGAAAAVTLAGAATACALLHLPAGREAALVGGGLFLLAWGYFAILLYRGIGFDAGHVSFRASALALRRVAEHASDLPTPDFSPAGGVDDLAGALLALIAGALAALAAVVLVWLGLNLALATAAGLAALLYWLFRRSLRAVMANLRRTRGQAVAALATGAWYAAGYALVVTGALWAIDAGVQRLAG